MVVTIAVGAFCALVSLAMFFLIRREVRIARADTLEAFRDMMRKAHGKGEPCPAGAPEVVSPSPAPAQAVQALARVAGQGRTAAPPPPPSVTAPQSGVRRSQPPPASVGPATPQRTAPGDERAARTKSSHPPPPVEVVVTREAQPPPQPERETLTPTDPSTRPLDARVRRRWTELVTEAQAKGEEATHCHGALCLTHTEETELCECQCDGCALLLELLVKAERDVRREMGQE